VLFLIHSLGHGGSERQLSAYARALDRTRFAPHAASVIGGFRAEEMRAAGIPVFELPLRGLLRRNTLRVARDLRAYIRQNRIRIVHTFDYGPALFGVAVARSCGVIALSSQRFYMDSVPGKARGMILASHWLAHGVVVNSAALQQYLHHKFRYPLKRIHICPNGLDPRIFCPEPRARLDAVAEAGLVIGTVCVLRPEKNLGQLIEVFGRIRLRRPAAKLLIVGSGPEEVALKAACARLGLGDSAIFLPTTSDVAPALRSIDIFVHPSLSEGMPNAVMEAMACGCAVVATRVGGTPELIEPGVHGLLVEPGDARALEAGIETLLQDAALREKMGTAASQRIRGEFSTEAAGRRLGEIYERYLAAASRP